MMKKAYAIVFVMCSFLLLIIFQLDEQLNSNNDSNNLRKKNILPSSAPTPLLDTTNTQHSPLTSPTTSTIPNTIDTIAYLEELLFRTIDVNELTFYSIVNTTITQTLERGEEHPYSETNHTYHGQLYRFPEHASYKVVMRTKQYKEQSDELISDFTSEVDYSINNSAVYFSTEGGALNYYPFTKEDGLLETVGQLEKLAALFMENKEHITILHSQDKHYITLTLPDEQLIAQLPLLTETVFNGYFNTYTKAELEQQQEEREELNWPKKISNPRISFVLNSSFELESYYVYFNSDAYSFDDSYHYTFSLITSFYNINDLAETDDYP